MIMINKCIGRVALAVMLSTATLMPVSAQTSGEMTADEIKQAFEKQKTRGLVLVPADEQETTTTQQTATVQPATSYAEVEKSDQVNIQISFDFDSATLREDQKPKLVTLCSVMQSVDVKLFQIVGHTDSSGTAAYNKQLSLLRAQEVKRHLVNDCGIADERLEAIGLGEEAPFNEQDTRSDENRRVEFQALG